MTRVRRKLFTGEPSGRGQVLETFEVSRIWIRRHVCLLYQPIHVFQQDRAYGVNRSMPGQSLTLKPRKRLHDHWLCRGQLVLHNHVERLMPLQAGKANAGAAVV